MTRVLLTEDERTERTRLERRRRSMRRWSAVIVVVVVVPVSARCMRANVLRHVEALSAQGEERSSRQSESNYVQRTNWGPGHDADDARSADRPCGVDSLGTWARSAECLDVALCFGATVQAKGWSRRKSVDARGQPNSRKANARVGGLPSQLCGLSQLFTLTPRPENSVGILLSSDAVRTFRGSSTL